MNPPRLSQALEEAVAEKAKFAFVPWNFDKFVCKELGFNKQRNPDNRSSVTDLRT